MKTIQEPASVAITGSSGLIGSALTRDLLLEKSQVLRMVRKDDASDPGKVPWDPLGGEVDTSALEGIDAVVHLAGAPVAQRWTDQNRKAIEDSRVVGTQTLVGALCAMERPPKVLVAASAVGYYGDRGDEVLDESSVQGDGFLADVCGRWEAATKPARDRGIRVVNVRTGLVLAKDGGALKKMLPPFKMGIGGRLGDGEQWMSWISLEDQVAIYRRAIEDDGMAGIYNAVAPHPVTNAEFTRALGRALNRPTVLPVPGFALKGLFGEMATMLLGGQRVHPVALQREGFDFVHTDLDSALAAALQ